MTEFWPFGRGRVVSGNPDKVGVILLVSCGSVGEHCAGVWDPDFLFVALWGRLFGLALTEVWMLAAHRLALASTANIDLPGLAVCAPMLDIADVENLAIFEVVAFGMLPGITTVAPDGIPVVVMKATDAFDGVVFFLFRMRSDRSRGIERLRR